MEWIDYTKLGSDGSDFRNIVYSQAINRSCSCRLAEIFTSSEKKLKVHDVHDGGDGFDGVYYRLQCQ